jgi:hypothetical protein
VAVDTVLADEERDGEPILRREIHREADPGAEDVQQRPGLPRVDERQVLGASVEHQQLTDLLLERHAGDQVSDPLVHRQRGIPVGQRAGRGGLRRHTNRRGHEWEQCAGKDESGQEAKDSKAWHEDLDAGSGRAGNRGQADPTSTAGRVAIHWQAR